MSRRKGLSHEEKRTKMMELFYERKDFFQLKELEKLGPKEKGVISQAVKDVVQSLVDDGMVDTDKIGTCVYFWAFPSKATSVRKRKMDELTSRDKELNKRLKTSQAKVEKATVGREDDEERQKILEELSQLESKKDKLLQDLQKYRDSDPDVLKQVVEQTKVALDASNRWTDNIFAVKSWCKKKFFIEEGTLNKQFSIPEELDYV